MGKFCYNCKEETCESCFRVRPEKFGEEDAKLKVRSKGDFIMAIVSSAPLSTGFRLPQTVVEVKFSNRATKWQGDSDSVYSFNSDLKDLNVGDLVVCDCSTGYSIGSVVSIAQIDASGRTSRWLVQKLDLTRHSERLAEYYGV